MGVGFRRAAGRVRVAESAKTMAVAGPRHESPRSGCRSESGRPWPLVAGSGADVGAGAEKPGVVAAAGARGRRGGLEHRGVEAGRRFVAEGGRLHLCRGRRSRGDGEAAPCLCLLRGGIPPFRRRDMVMRTRRDFDEPVLVTDARASYADEHGARKRKYLRQAAIPSPTVDELVASATPGSGTSRLSTSEGPDRTACERGSGTPLESPENSPWPTLAARAHTAP